MKLSGVVITLNEEKNIDRCLKSLAFCDEIVVVDSGSTDKTLECASKYTHNIVSVPWRGYAAQKNKANSLAVNDWIISLDGDEECPAELRDEIVHLMKQGPEHAAFRIPRKTFHSGKWIRHGGWYPNYLVRLFNRTQGEWLGNELHEYWQCTGNVGQLKSNILHYSFGSVSEQVERNARYAALGAQALRNKGRAFSVFSLAMRPPVKFIELYLLKQGLRDGLLGFIIAVLASYSVFLKWATLWQLERKAK